MNYNLVWMICEMVSLLSLYLILIKNHGMIVYFFLGIKILAVFLNAALKVKETFWGQNLNIETGKKVVFFKSLRSSDH